MRLASPSRPDLTARRGLATTEARRSDALRHLSSGLRVTRGRDDPAGLIASSVLRQDRTKNLAVAEGAMRARHAASTAEAALASVNAHLLEARALVSANAGNTRGPAEREANQQQLDRILEDVDRILASAEAHGRPLFRTPPAAAPAGPPPVSFDRAGDIGGYTPGGSHTQAGDDFTVTGGGRDIFRRNDQFYFLRSDVTGGGELTARVDDVAGLDMEWSQAAVMWRETDADNSAMVALVRRPDGQVRLKWRGYTNAFANQGPLIPAPDAPGYLRLRRTGNLFEAERSSDNVTWTPVGNVTFAMSPDAVAGIGVTAHQTGALSTATFGEVMLPGAAAAPVEPDPYPDVAAGLLSGDPDDRDQTSRVFLLGSESVGGLASLRIERVDLRTLGDAGGELRELASGGRLDSREPGTQTIAGRVIDSAIRQASTLRGRVGRFERFIVDPADRQASLTATHLADAGGRVRDADVARETAELARLDLLRAGGVDALRIVGDTQRQVLDLLR